KELLNEYIRMGGRCVANCRRNLPLYNREKIRDDLHEVCGFHKYNFPVEIIQCKNSLAGEFL
ncbi:MAG: hypothetical protein RRZ33_10130, partial [Lachnospiraceae bacterium]